jgi:hypothetical protein
MYGSYKTVFQISGTVVYCLWVYVNYRSQNKFYLIEDWEGGDLYQASSTRFMKYRVEDNLSKWILSLVRCVCEVTEIVIPT